MAEPIAKVSVEIEAKIAQLEAALKKVQSDMEATAAKARESASRIRDAYGSVDASVIAEQQRKWNERLAQTKVALDEVAAATLRMSMAQDDASDSFERTERQFSKQSRTIEKESGSSVQAMAKMREAATKLLIPVAIAKGVVALREKWVQAKDEVAAYDKMLQQAGRSMAELAKIEIDTNLTDEQKKIQEVLRAGRDEAKQITDELEKELRKRSSLFGSFIRTMASFTLRGQLVKDTQEALDTIAEAANRRAERLQDRQLMAAKRRAQELREAAEKEARALELGGRRRLEDESRSAREQLYLAGLAEAERFAAQVELTFKAFVKQLEIEGVNTSDQVVKEQLEAYRKYLQLKADEDKKAFDERLDSEKRAELEKAAEVAKRYEEAMTAAFQRAADALKFSLGDTFGDTGALVRALNETARAVRERGRI